MNFCACLFLRSFVLLYTVHHHDKSLFILLAHLTFSHTQKQTPEYHIMSSPSEFLTFYRRAVISTPRILRVAQLNARPAVRTFAASSRRGDKSTITEKSNEHSTDKAKKGNDYDVGSSNVKAGME